MREKMREKITAAILILAFLSSSAVAQSVREGNRVIFAPYLWATSLDGKSTIGALPPLDIDASFSDLASNLEFAASLHTEFHRGPWRLVVDPMYINLSADAPPLTPIPPDAPGAKLDVTMWLVELWGAYAVTDNWEVLGGVRYQDQDLTASRLQSPPSPSTQLGVNDSWSNWFAGVRFNTALGSKWFFTWRGDVKIAGDSDTNYNTELFFNRRFGENMALNLGYRYMRDDYANTGVYGWDMLQQGPVLGYTWAF
mgnify:FL=1